MNDPIGLEAGDWWDIPANIRKAVKIGKEELDKRGAGNHNNEGDAMRHAEWSRRMSKGIGPVTSWTAGVVNEVKGALQGHPWSEAMMDINNNSEGRTAAREKRPVDRNKLQKTPKNGLQVNPYDPKQYWFER
jgi:hypothetical protein